VSPLSFLRLCVDTCQESFGKAGSGSAGEQKPIRTLVANEQGAKVLPVSFWECVTANNELLKFGDLEFNPGAAASTAFRRLSLVFWQPAPRDQTAAQPGVAPLCCREVRQRAGCSRELFKAAWLGVCALR
jgi:hypothetical protein